MPSGEPTSSHLRDPTRFKLRAQAQQADHNVFEYPMSPINGRFIERIKRPTVPPT